MRKIVIIVGPTAIGKTALALKTAKKHNGMLLSADSIQVYKGLDIISGKDKDTLGNIPLKLVDLVAPHTPFNISDYVSCFEKELQIASNLSIVVGGSGFYISAFLNPIKTQNIKPDEALRKELEKCTVSELAEKLRALNPEKLSSMNSSDVNNPRRLIRAIEVSSKYQVVSSKYEDEIKPLENHDVLITGLTCVREVLIKKIDNRVEERLKQGALKEAKSLFENYEDLAPQVKDASGYRQLFEYLQGKHSLDEAIDLWKTAEHQNAKKQMTWFKKQKNIEWFDIQKPDFEAEILQKVEEFLKN